MPERVVSVRLQAKVEGFTAGMRKAKASVDDLTKADVPKSSKAFGDLADKAALAGAAIGVGLGVAVKRFADFDAAMSAVRANSGATGAELESLRAQAIKLGADSQFSATEAAQGVNELAKAGVDTAAILNGGLKGALDLAAAGQIEVAQAAETTASALTQFGLSGDKASHVADLLTNGANKAQGSVLDMGQALNQAGLVANATGLTIEETTAGLTAFAAAGLIGSDAGTSFKTMLQRLSAPSKESAELMAELGINAYDSSGQFVGLSNVAGQLQSALGDLTPEQRNSALATIFGADAVRAANVLYAEGADGIAKWTSEVTKQGAAAAQAATLTDNLQGDLERLGGAFDSVLIETGSGANSSLRTLVQGVTGLVDIIGKVPGPVLLAGGALTSLALLAPKGINAYRNYTATLDSVGLSFEKIAARGPRAAKAVDLAGSAASGAAKAFGVLAAAGAATSLLTDDSGAIAVEKLTSELLEADDAVSAFSSSIKANASDMGFIQGDLENFGNVLRASFDPDFLDSFNAKGDSALKTISFGMIDLTTTTDEAGQRLGELDAVLSNLVANGSAQQASSLFDQFARAAEAQGISVDQLKSKLPQYAEALSGAANQSALAAGQGDLLTQANEATAQSAEDARKEIDDYVKSLQDAGLAVLGTREAQRGLRQAIADATAAAKENGRTLDISTQKGRDNQSALDDVARSALDLADAIYEETGSEARYRESLAKSRTSLIEAGIRFGLTRAEAKKYADQILQIPTAKSTKVTIRTSGLADLKKAQDYLRGINSKDVKLTVGTVRVGNTKVNAGQFDDLSQKRRATGGAIIGPGTGTSDSIPALLSNGEHVWTAAEVAQLGGQSAVYALRAAVRAGNLPRFANGGAVPSYAPPPQYVRVARSSSPANGATYAPTFQVNGADSYEAAQRAMREFEYRVVASL